MLDLTFRQIGPDTYQKWNGALGVRTTIRFDRAARQIHVRHDQPAWLVDAVLDRNVALQNAAKASFKNDLVTQTTSMPIAVHRQVMAQCGFQPGHGYDEKKFRRIMNDRDNYKLKTIPGRI
jgi:hypothetical protein